MVVKNYKEMCKLLDEKEKSGKSKQYQLKNWKRFFTWENKGHQFIIEDIFIEPLEIVDERKNNRAIYVRYIEWLLAQDLSKREGYTHTLTKKRWWNLLGMVNKRYVYFPKEDLALFSPLHNEDEVNWFYNRCYSVMNDILRNALNSMKDRSLIDYEMQTVIVCGNDKNKWFIATDKDIAEIQTVKKNILREMQVPRESVIFAKRKQDEFYKKVYSVLYEKFGWDRYYRQIKIIFNPENIQKALPEIAEDIEKEVLWDKIEDNKIGLNEAVVNRMNKDAEVRYNKAFERNESGESTFMLPDNYIEAQNSLTYYLVDLKSMNEEIIENNIEKPMPQIDNLFFDLLI